MRRTRGEIVFLLAFETCLAEVVAVFLEAAVFVGLFSGVFAEEFLVAGAVFSCSMVCGALCALGLSACDCEVEAKRWWKEGRGAAIAGKTRLPKPTATARCRHRRQFEVDRTTFIFRRNTAGKSRNFLTAEIRTHDGNIVFRQTAQ
jgi:hypothetical protein